MSGMTAYFDRSMFFAVPLVLGLQILGLSGCSKIDEAFGESEPDPMEQASYDIPDEIEALEGLDLAEFENAAAELGYVVRVVRIDGESVLVTAGLDTSRVNVAVVGGVVEQALRIG